MNFKGGQFYWKRICGENIVVIRNSKKRTHPNPSLGKRGAKKAQI
jgi:hypothetical protein